jgi:hypothetical protein
LGVVLATQNPVDLDYKGLSNTGTWFLGRLQTERDKTRVIEGLEGASAQAGSTFDRSEMESILAALGSRKFLMNNVHKEKPIIFETRWAMSYLRGPLTREQIRKLSNRVGELRQVETDQSTEASENVSSDEGSLSGAVARFELGSPSPASEEHEGEPVETVSSEADEPGAIVPSDSAVRGTIPEGVRQYYLSAPLRLAEGWRLVYRPALIARGRVHFVRTMYNIDQWQTRTFLYEINDGTRFENVWDNSELIPWEMEFDQEPEAAECAKLPGELLEPQNYKNWEREFRDFLYRDQQSHVWRCAELKLFSTLGQDEGDFRVRLNEVVSERRDKEIEKVREKYSLAFQSIRDRIRRADAVAEKEKEQYQQTRLESILSVGSSLMGALLGRKRVSKSNLRRANSSVRSIGRSSKEKGDFARAKEERDNLIAKFKDLERDFNEAIIAIGEKLNVARLPLEKLPLAPRKTEISIDKFGICWMPFTITAEGTSDPAF